MAWPWGVRMKLRDLVTILFLSGCLFLFFLLTSRKNPTPEMGLVEETDDDRKMVMMNSSANCDLFSGKWVFDNSSNNNPLYSDLNCSFMDDGMACEKYGRKDLNYRNWRWQPHACDLPRFEAKAMLEKLRNKRLVFVGDSLNRNQWVSMVCLVDSVIPPSQKSLNSTPNGSLVTFHAIEYNATISFHWAPLLVESNCDDPWHHRMTDRIVKIRDIEKHAEHWSDADVVVFNSYIWWVWLKVKILDGTIDFESPNATYVEMDAMKIYAMALNTLSDWVETHVNRSKTKLFFVSMSPSHQMAEEWDNNSAGGNCYNETEPISIELYKGRGTNPEIMTSVETAVEGMKKKGVDMQLLNITQLSVYRKDGHSSIYRKHWDTLTKEQEENPKTYADCIHWCLPGVPDVWNQLLYAHLLRPS
ncbi:protein trichome birefringence-like 34 [Impatiens glandulifera]|uniref:protein trichome birefringence-like 34 n=1 Tax=Impatiens glandulifera TaxID=253017 RepID=UPI001FB141EC|nr:protein trichome birefringence-like 34 [Impatiens glandulifera]